MEDFLSVKEFARCLAVHENTIRRLIKNKRIDAIRVSDSKKARWRIPESEVNRMGVFDLKQLIEQEVNKRLRECKRVL